MPKVAVPTVPDLYTEQVKLALAHYHEPAWLAEQSPLAASYWLGQPPVNKGVGQWCQEVLYETATTLWNGELPTTKETLLELVNEERGRGGKGNRYLFLILEMHYFHRHFQIPKANFIWEDYLFIGKSQYYRDLEVAISTLGERLLERLKPSFRMEIPVPDSAIVERPDVVRQCLKVLHRGQRLMLTGAGGVGKTSVGRTLVGTWNAPVFWYTFRDSVNDQPHALWFALGYFLQRHGALGLWRQVVAGGGKLENPHLAMGLLRHDIASFGAEAPLLVFDNVDVLRPVNASQQRTEHGQLVDLLLGLKGIGPLLFIGQHATLEADHYVVIKPFSHAEVGDWLTRRGIEFEPNELQDFFIYSAGNPQLLQLCLALKPQGKGLQALLDDLPKTPVFQAIFERLWKRLDAETRRTMRALSVYRASAPNDAAFAQETLMPLAATGFLQIASDQRITMMPLFRQWIYHTLPADERELLHLHAAQIYVTRGLYTDAAYHLLTGGNVVQAIALWYERRKIEMASGRAYEALQMFQDVSSRRLDDLSRQKLAVIRGDLYRYAGDPDRALADLESVADGDLSMVMPEVKALEGWLLQKKGDYQGSLDKYEAGLNDTLKLLQQRITLQVQRGVGYVRYQQLQKAWQEATLARYEAEHLQGVVQEAMGNYSVARSHFTVALALAEEMRHDTGVARTQYHLAGLAGRQGDFVRAAQHLQASLRHYEYIGDRFMVECVRVNLAALYVQTHDFEEAIRNAGDALLFFQSIRHSYWSSVAASNLAEASYGAHLYDEAERAAHIVLAQEEVQSDPYALMILGHVHRARQNHEDAITNYEHAIRLAEKNEDKYVEAFAWRGMSDSHKQANRQEDATQALLRALALFEQMQMAHEVEKTRTMLEMA